ncbi:hypothetical protein V498_05932 [Pseudogymnoascus sp. VKM F-4517 (FW-2822)]|nr:hypothetical protein V498_05932 [Pseudogymnoascus sp. VKM F-4517 (FW-2822)]
MLHARSPASGSPSPGGGMERSSYFMTSASASSPSAEMARYGGCTSNPWMNGPSSGYTPTSQLPSQQQQQQQSSTQQIQAQQAQAQSDPHNRSHRPGTDTHTPTPLSARGAAENLGSYFSPWSSECAHTPPLGSRGPDDEPLKTSEQDGFFAHRATHTSSSSSSTAASAAAVPQIHLQQRHTHAHNTTRPHLRPAPPRSTVTFPLTMASPSDNAIAAVAPGASTGYPPPLTAVPARHGGGGGAGGAAEYCALAGESEAGPAGESGARDAVGAGGGGEWGVVGAEGVC